jgi:hypothetical protein
MGGVGSSRWTTTVTRVTTEGLPRLDVRALAHAGALRPGTVTRIRWGPDAAIATVVPPDRTGVLVLRYDVGIGSRRLLLVEESLCLVTAPCTFGGVRVWFACPGCGARCAVLYSPGGLFRCRACHRLAYVSTRRP